MGVDSGRLLCYAFIYERVIYLYSVTVYMTERPASLLTRAQREKMAEESDDAYSRQYRQRIRERTVSGVRDLALLFEHMEARDIERAFSPDKSIIEQTGETLQAVLDILSKQAPADRFRDRLRSVRTYRDRLRELDEEIRELEDEKRALDSSQDDGDSVFSSATSQRRKDIEEEIRKLEDEREKTASDLRHWMDELAAALSNRYSALTEAREDVSNIPVYELPETYRDDVRHIESMLRDEIRQVEQAGQVASESDTSDRDVSELIERADAVDEQFQKFDSGFDGQSTTSGIVGEIQALQSELESDLETPEFAPGLREDYRDAIAFLLRISEVLGTNTGELNEEALVEMFEKEHPEQVVGDADVDVTAENRETALERGLQKDEEERLSVTELRAIADAEPEDLVRRRETREKRQFTERELRELVAEDPSLVESGLSIQVREPKVAGSDHGPVPDMIAQDAEGSTVLLEFKILDSQDPAKAVDRLNTMIDEFGGKDRVRGILVVPTYNDDPAREEFSAAPNVELVRVDVDPY